MVKILVMDNEEDILSSVKTILQRENYEVTCVATGQNAIKQVETRKFDLAILDVMMPDISGWDVFESITKINPKQKILFFSVLEISPERKKQIEKYGPAEYLLKPFDREVLIKHVNSMLGTEKKPRDQKKPTPPKKGIKQTLKKLW